MPKPKSNQPNVEKLKKENLELAQELGITLVNKPDPIEEIKQEWEDDDYHFTNKEDCILISNKEKYFFIGKISKRCSVQNWQDENSVVSITPKEIIRLTKTFRALEWEI